MSLRSAFLISTLILPSAAIADTDTVTANGWLPLSGIHFETGRMAGWVWTFEGGPASSDVVEERGWVWRSGAWFQGTDLPGQILSLAGREPELVTLHIDRIDEVEPESFVLLHWVTVVISDDQENPLTYPLCEDADGNSTPAIVLVHDTYGRTFECVGDETNEIVVTIDVAGFEGMQAQGAWTFMIGSDGGLDTVIQTVVADDVNGCVGCQD